jgi:hypothetical protein
MRKRLADPGEQRTGQAVADRSAAGLAAVDTLVAVGLVAVGRRPVVADKLAVVEAPLALLHLACSVLQLCGVGGGRCL